MVGPGEADGQVRPGVPEVGGAVDRPRRRGEVDASRVEVVHGHGSPEDGAEGVGRRKPLRRPVPRPPSIRAPVDLKPPVHGDPVLVALLGCDEQRSCASVDHDGESEGCRKPGLVPLPAVPPVRGAVHPRVVLPVDPVGVRGVLGQAVDTATDVLVDLVLEHRRDPLVARDPGRTAVVGSEHADGRYAAPDPARIGVVEEQGVGTEPASARDPCGPGFVVVEAGDGLPARAPVGAREETCVLHPGVQHASMLLQGPDLSELGTFTVRVAGTVLDLLPASVTLGNLQSGAIDVAGDADQKTAVREAESRRDLPSLEERALDVPGPSVLTGQPESTLRRPHQEPYAHRSIPRVGVESSQVASLRVEGGRRQSGSARGRGLQDPVEEGQSPRIHVDPGPGSQPVALPRVAHALERLAETFQLRDRQLELTIGRPHVLLPVHHEQGRVDVLDAGQGVAHGVDVGPLLRAPGVARLDEDAPDPVGVGVRVGEVVDAGHGDRGVEDAGDAGDGRHGGDTPVAVPVDTDLPVYEVLIPEEGSAGRGVPSLGVGPVVDGQVLELTPEARSSPVVHRQHHVSLGSQVLLEQAFAPEIGVGPAAVDVDQGRMPVAGAVVRRHVEEALDVEVVEAPEGDLDGLDHRGPRGSEPGEAADGAARGRDQIHVSTPEGGGPDEREEVAVGACRDRREGASHVRDPGGDAAIHGHRPQVEIAPLLVREVDPPPVSGPENAEVVEPVGAVHLHLDRSLRPRLRVEDEDVCQVFVPVAVLARPEERDVSAVGRPRGLRRGHEVVGHLSGKTGLQVYDPDVVVPVVGCVGHVGDLPTVRGPGRSPSEVVRGVGLRRDLSRGRRPVGGHDPDVLTPRMAGVEGHEAPVGRDAGVPLVQLVVRDAEGGGTVDGLHPEVAFPQVHDRLGVGGPARAGALGPEGAGLLRAIRGDSIDSPPVGAVRHDSHVGSVRAQRSAECPGPGTVDVLQGELEGGLPRARRLQEQERSHRQVHVTLSSCRRTPSGLRPVLTEGPSRDS